MEFRAYQDLMGEPEDSRDNRWIEYEEGGLDKPEPPEALLLYYRLKMFQTTLCTGGFLMQPHLHLLEMETVESAERTYTAQQVANALLKEKAHKPKQE